MDSNSGQARSVKITAVLVFTFALATGLKGDALAEIKVVFLREKEIWIVTEAGSGERKLTTDNRPKSAPIWSPDGERIAYIVAPPLEERENVLGEVDIIDPQGKYLSSWFVSKKFPEDGVALNSFSHLEWVDSFRLGYVGHINPSLSEYRSVEAMTGKILASYPGTKHQWSPDRSKLAYLGWQPHFYRKDLISEYVEINNKIAFSSLESTIKYAIESPLTWAPNSKHLAFIAKEQASGKEILVVLDEDRMLKKELSQDLNGVNWLMGDEGDTIFLLKAHNIWALKVPDGELLLLKENVRDKILSKLKKEESTKSDRARIIQSLRGTSANWWPH